VPAPPEGEAPPVVPVPGLVGAGATVAVPAFVAVPALTPAAELVVVLVVEELVEELAAAAAAALAAEVGTVNAGAPAVSVVPEPPPQAARQSVVISAPTVAAGRSLLAPAFTTASGAEWLHAPAAVRAVVEILLGELIAPVAEAQVLHRPRELRERWGQWEKLADHLQRLSGLAIHVRLPRLCFDDHFASGGGRPHPVLLARPHCGAMLPVGLAAAICGPPTAARQCRALG
jgi:hypothetical protein